MSRSALVYIAFGVIAIILAGFVLFSGGAGDGNTVPETRRAALESLRSGDMKKLRIHQNYQPVSDAAFELESGQAGQLRDYQGKVVLLNFWATWCAPCRKEMPMLAELQTDLGGSDFEVVTIATGRNPRPAIDEFFDGIGVSNLPKNRDPGQELSRAMGALGLPVTVILDREGREIARLQGDADWASASAKSILKAVIAH